MKDKVFAASEFVFLVVLWLVLGVGALLGGIGALGWQVVHWLSTAEWVPISVLDFLRWADFNNWVSSPQSWHGLWRLLNWFPASLAGVLVGFLFAAMMRDET